MTLTPAGASVVTLIGRGERPPGARLGPRQDALLAELADGVPESGVPAARLAERHGASAVSGLVRRGWLALVVATRERRPLAGRSPGERGSLPAGAALSDDQVRVVTRVSAAMRERRADPLLLEGVVASGKTAVYAAAIDAALAAGRDALVLVPEASLALPLVDRLRHDLAIEPVLVHGGLSAGERADEWRRLRAATEPVVVVGTRLAILAPLRDPGLIVVDEEHDPAYKSDRTPRYHARDLALELGRLAGAPVILGSATPDIVSVGRSRQGLLTRMRLVDRAAGHAPSVEVVDLRAELAEGNRGLLSAALVEALSALDTARGRAGDPGHQPPWVGVRRPVPGLRLCPDLSRVPAAAGLPCRPDGAPLPSLRRHGTARPPMPVVCVAAHPLPRRWHPAGGAGGRRPVPGAARRPPRPGRRGASWRCRRGHR